MKRFVYCTTLMLFTLIMCHDVEAQSGSRSSRSKKSGAAATTTAIAAGDWNQFRGPRRDNLSPESGLADKWPEGGPELLQTISGIGEGYASVSLVGELM